MKLSIILLLINYIILKIPINLELCDYVIYNYDYSQSADEILEILKLDEIVK